MTAGAASMPVRLGVVGIGGFGLLHARTLAALAEAELVALVDTSEASLARALTALPTVRAFDSLEGALLNAAAEAWVVATPTASHVPIAETLLHTGASVLVEKPLAPDAEAAHRLGPLIAPKSRNFMAGHLVLFAPEFRALLREIDQRGPVAWLQAVRHRPLAHSERYPDESPLRLTMVHDLYMALAMTGGAEPARMSARLRPHPDRPSQADLALAEIEWPNGAWGSFAASFLTPPGMPADGYDRLEVFGRGWAARLSLNPRPLEVWAERAEWPLSLDIHLEPGAPAGWLAEELRCFCRVVRGAQDVPVGARFEDALRITRWLDALERSAAQEV